MKRITQALLLLFFLLFTFSPLVVYAQDLYFRVEQEIVDFYFEADGALRIEYSYTFINDPGADPIDFVDIGLPTSDYDLQAITATVDGRPIQSIEPSPYVSPGVALGLGANQIRPGERGTLRATFPNLRGVLFTADIEGYVSARVEPNYFDRPFVEGTTDLTVSFHLPPGVGPEEGRWFDPPGGWPQEEPSTSLDAEGRVLYTWRNPQANSYTQYRFGIAFPEQYVPADAPQQPDVTDRVSDAVPFLEGLACLSGNALFFCGFIALFGGFIALAIYGSRRSKLNYLPPKISIEGHGIKRGLTAVEAAILLESPLDKVLTMILFGVIKKGAVKVVQEDPLQLERLPEEPENLREYEKEFIGIMIDEPKRARQAKLQRVVINLVDSVKKKMKGFSLKETQEYYRSIMKKAWTQIEAAETPEIRSERYAKDLEWTMLDRDFDDRTRRVFRTGPVYLPTWWGYYRPSMPGAGGASTVRTGAPAPASRPSGGPSLPTLPGSDFAASMVNSVQNTAGNLVSNVLGFTSGVTAKTNPPPPPSRSSFSGRSGGSGCACACACACAGCACACAGGGR